MTDAKHVRINELARELEVKAKVIIHLLPCFGVAELDFRGCEPTYEELLARVQRLESERDARTNFRLASRTRRKRKRKKKRKAKPFRTVSGGLPSLGKR